MIRQMHGVRPMILRKLNFLVAIQFSLVQLLFAAEEAPDLSAAKKEGKVVLYVSTNLPLAQGIARGFEQKYPFLKVDITRTSGESLLNRIKTEKLAGKILFDVVYGATVPLLPALGVVKPYVSSQAQAYPQKFREAKDFGLESARTTTSWATTPSLSPKLKSRKTGKI